MHLVTHIVDSNRQMNGRNLAVHERNDPGILGLTVPGLCIINVTEERFPGRTPKHV